MISGGRYRVIVRKQVLKEEKWKEIAVVRVNTLKRVREIKQHYGKKCRLEVQDTRMDYKGVKERGN